MNKYKLTMVSGCVHAIESIHNFADLEDHLKTRTTLVTTEEKIIYVRYIESMERIK